VRTLTRAVCIAFLYVTVALTVTFLFMLRLGIEDTRLDLGSLIDGTARRPYASRVLMPALVEAAVALSGRAPSTGPASLTTKGALPWEAAAMAAGGRGAASHPLTRLGSRLLHEMHAPPEAYHYAYEYAVFFALSFLCILGFGFLLRALTRLCYPNNPGVLTDLGPVIGLAIIPLVFFRYSNLVHDPTTLFVFTLCLYLIVKRSRVWYLVVFPFAVLNKETAILLPIIFLLRESRFSPRRQLAGLMVVQLGVYGGVRLLLTHALKGQPGSLVEMHLRDNLALMRGLGVYAKTLGAVGPLAVPVFYGWRRKPVFLRRGLIATAFPLASAAFFFGMFAELRGYYEAYPFVFLLAVPAVAEVFGVSVGPSGSGRDVAGKPAGTGGPAADGAGAT
jgi:hypothetical protein